MALFSRGCEQKLFPPHVGVMPNVESNADDVVKRLARFGHYGLDGDGVYVPDTLRYEKLRYMPDARLFALHMGPYATGTELRVATVKDLLEVRNGGNAATAELYGGWADMAWEVAGEQEDADMYAVNQEINRLQQRQYFIPMQQVFFQPGQPGHRWWKPSEAELSRKLLGLYHWEELKAVNVRRDAQGTVICREKTFRITGRLTVRQVLAACKLLVLPNAVYEHKASKGKRIMLTDLVKSGGSGVVSSQHVAPAAEEPAECKKLKTC